ncbi:MAG: hypothetical protein JJU28_13815 [Cyclobacteriaceae bacterium]|nr:hypothetical protein [Cyclobacteriaceae bacterium]
MITKIANLDDVSAFAKLLVKESVNFHPDEDFINYINIQTAEPTYTAKEAEVRNALMAECFEVCDENGIDIYDFMSKIVLQETAMDKLIPQPV